MEPNQKKIDSPKVKKIIQCALEIIRDKGDQGLSMRGVSSKADMSLSNLQHYFKNKDELLKGMVDYYYGTCGQILYMKLKESRELPLGARIDNLISFGLDHGGELTEICRIFREFWAIATRNEAVKQHMEDYYSAYARTLDEYFGQNVLDPEKCQNIVSLLLPYFEGYSITANSLPVSREGAHKMLRSLVISLIEEKSATT